MPRDKNARVGAAVPSVGGYCCWIRFFFFFFFFSPPTIRFSPFFILLFQDGIRYAMEWGTEMEIRGRSVLFALAGG